MKKITLFKSLTIFSLCFFAAMSLHATTDTINASGTSFTPSTLTINVGDTVCFTGIGTFHPLVFSADTATKYTTSGTCFVGGDAVLPEGLNAFYCDNHKLSIPPMVGGITVEAVTTGLTALNEETMGSKAFPNPFSTITTIVFSGFEVERVRICDITGRTVKIVEPEYGTGRVEMDLTELNKGMYFYSLMNGHGIIETRKLIKNR